MESHPILLSNRTTEFGNILMCSEQLLLLQQTKVITAANESYYCSEQLLFMQQANVTCLNPNRSFDFSRIACNCRADFFCVLRRRSGLRQVKDKRKMCGKGMQGGEELNQNTLIRSNDQFGLKSIQNILWA